MLELLNLLFLSVELTVAPPIYVQTDVPAVLPHLGQVIYKEGFKPELFSESCRYSGVIVAFDRDWDEEVTTYGDLKSTVKADPGKLAGYAFLVNKELCPGKPAKHVSFVYDTFTTSSIVYALTEPGHAIKALPLSAQNTEFYKWLPQVMKRIEVAAETDPVAKDYLEFNRQAAEPAKATKTAEIAEASEVAETAQAQAQAQ